MEKHQRDRGESSQNTRSDFRACRLIRGYIKEKSTLSASSIAAGSSSHALNIHPLRTRLGRPAVDLVDHLCVARELLGIDSETAFRLAVQGFINEAGFQFREFWGVGVLVACPNCGATIDNLEGWEPVDHERDDRYIGARCKVCGWSDGSEM